MDLTSRGIPWGSGERAGEFTKLVAMHRFFSPGSNFFSAAPDDVHDLMAVRWGYPFVGRDCFPAETSGGGTNGNGIGDFKRAVQGGTPAERIVGVHDMSEPAMQRRAAKNPIATTLFLTAKSDSCLPKSLASTTPRTPT
jgi:hypothetical protein